MIVPDWSGELPEGRALVPFAPSDACEEQRRCCMFKSPSYEKGNLRCLRLVNPNYYPQLAHHKACVVLSTQGLRPEADKMFGADYDGDKVIGGIECIYIYIYIYMYIYI